MKKQKVNVQWELQPAHGDSKTYLHDGKMFIKVGPASENVQIEFVSNGMLAKEDNLLFEDTADAYSYYNQKWIENEKEMEK